MLTAFAHQRRIAVALSTIALVASMGVAQAADITGAGATFPAPVYRNGARRRAAAGNGSELPVDRLGRRHQPDPATAPSTSAPPTRR